MSERPILFNSEMVRAVLSGRKTQTRRPVRGPVDYLGGAPTSSDPAEWGYWVEDQWGRWAVLGRGLDEHHHNGRVSIPCPLGQPGDRLWVRETWYCDHCFAGDYLSTIWSGWTCSEAHEAKDNKTACEAEWRDDLYYRADGESHEQGLGADSISWRPSIHMPRWASRITLEIADVRVQRVQEITAEEAVAEGVRCHICDGRVDGTSENDCACFHAVPLFEFLWRSIYGAESWQQNAWVWAVTFRVLTACCGRGGGR